MGEARIAHWKLPKEIRREYPAASFLKGNRVVFNIKGNHRYEPQGKPRTLFPQQAAGYYTFRLWRDCATKLFAALRLQKASLTNKYRLIVKMNYDYEMIWIRFVGTHTQNDKIDAVIIYY